MRREALRIKRRVKSASRILYPNSSFLEENGRARKSINYFSKRHAICNCKWCGRGRMKQKGWRRQRAEEMAGLHGKVQSLPLA
jgi:hypothetical protein